MGFSLSCIQASDLMCPARHDSDGAKGVGLMAPIGVSQWHHKGLCMFTWSAGHGSWVELDIEKCRAVLRCSVNFLPTLDDVLNYWWSATCATCAIGLWQGFRRAHIFSGPPLRRLTSAYVGLRRLTSAYVGLRALWIPNGTTPYWGVQRMRRSAKESISLQPMFKEAND